MSSPLILDLFAGPGGWSEGLRLLGLSNVGLEWDSAACATRAAAGHRTIRADVANYPTAPFAGKVTGLIASPPCQDFSMAGSRAGRTGTRGRLIDEVPRWVDALWPEWVACEQVPPALEVWREFAHLFRSCGYSVWAGVLNAADFGVPQTRQRAFLIASRIGPAVPPGPTHAKTPSTGLFGSTERWVSMAEALGWESGRSLNKWQGEGMVERHGERPDRDADEPAFTITGAATRTMRWQVDTRRDQRPDGTTQTFDPSERPAVTLTGMSGGQWVFHRPATTVAGDPRITARCHHDEGSQGSNAKTTQQVRAGDYEGTEPIKLTVAEALTLQSFRPDYPVQGTKTKQFEQIGNAVPPLLAAHVVGALTGRRIIQAQEAA